MVKVGGYVANAVGIGTLIAIVSYIGSCTAINYIAEMQNNFSGTTDVMGRTVQYSGTKHYNTRFKEAKGRLDMRYKGDGTIEIIDNDLTVPGLSLDDIVVLSLSDGTKIKFNNSGIYDNKGNLHMFEDNTEAQRFFQGIFSDAQAVHSKVEKALEETVLKK